MRPETASNLIRKTVWNLYTNFSYEIRPRDKKRLLRAIEEVYHREFDEEFVPLWEHIVDIDPEFRWNDLAYYSDRIMTPHRLAWFYYHIYKGNFQKRVDTYN